MPINFTLTYTHSTNDVDDHAGDVGAVSGVGTVRCIPQFSDNRPVLGDSSGFTIREFKGWIDSDGTLKAKAGGGAFRLWANDPSFNLERLTYKVVFDLTDPIGRPFTVTGGYFEAPSTDTSIDLKEVLQTTGTGSPGVTRGLRGYTPWFVKVSEDPPMYQVHDPDGPVGDPVALVAHDPALDAIAALTPANDDILQRKSGAWTNRTPVQLKADLAFALADVSGLTAALAGKQAALGYTAENTANKGAANGYPNLDSSGLIPASQLPSYVDDVLEYANLAGFPGTGATGKIYVDQSTAKIYRWSGSVYIEISPSPGSTDAVPEGSVNLYFTATERTKLAGVATGATANSPDATLFARANHTGTQAAATISDFASAADARIAASTKVSGSDNGTATALTLWKGTAAQYAAIGTKDASTVYVVLP